MTKYVGLAAVGLLPLCAGVPLPDFAKNFRNGTEVQALIDRAIATQASEVVLPAGDFLFGTKAADGETTGVPLLVSGASKLTIRGAGTHSTSLWFVPGFGLDVEGCTDVTLQQFSYDTVTPAFSQATLDSMDLAAQKVVVTVSKGFPMPDYPPMFNKSCADGSPRCGEIKCVFWDQHSLQIIQDQQMGQNIGAVSCDATTRQCTINLPGLDKTWSPPPPPGSLVTVGPRMWANQYPVPTYYKGTVGIFNCTRMLFDSIDMYGSADMAWVESLGGGANVYRNIRVVRRPGAPYPLRLLAANQDTFHSMSAEEGPTLERSEFAFMADDFINVHNRVLPVAHYDAASGDYYVLDVGTIPRHGFGGPTPESRNKHAVGHVLDFVSTGDVLKIYNAENHTFVAEAVVTAAPVVVDWPAGIPSGNMLEKRVLPDARVWYKVPTKGSSPVDMPYAYVMQIDRFSSKNAVVRNNYFHDSFNNLGRFAASNILVRDNIFNRTGDGIHISYDIAGFSFLEGSLGMHNLTFENNTFAQIRGCGPSRPQAPCYHVCDNVTCVFSHVDEALEPVIHRSGNIVLPL